MRVDAKFFKFRTMNCCGIVVTHFADVAGLKAPLLARCDRGGDLATWLDIGGAKFDFGSERRMVWKQDESVRSVEPDTDHVNLRGFRHNSDKARGSPECNSADKH